MKTKSLISIVCMFAASALPGSAALVAYDTFSGYTAGALNGQSQGFGWSGAWSAPATIQVTTSSGLTHSSNSSSGGTVTTNATVNGGATMSRNLATPLVATGDTYFGFLVQQPGTTATTRPHAAALQVSDAINDSIWAGSWDAQTFYGFGKNANGTFSTINSATADTTTTMFFVLKMELRAGTDTFRLFINPANAAALLGAGNINTTFTDFATPTALGFYHQYGPTANGNASFDEVRVGTAAADMFVTIPEPSTALLGGLGLLALLRRRR